MRLVVALVMATSSRREVQSHPKVTRRHSREAPLGSQAVKASIWELARRAARCVAHMESQTARAPMH
eukprot:COSAG05_NODE_11442_length_513_cov_0.830918_2_plen_66_part_01